MKELSRIIRRKRCHFISNSYQFHHKKNSIIRKFVIKKVGKFS